MIYVDTMKVTLKDEHWKWKEACHLFTDGDVDGLHVLAELIGLNRQWFQDRPDLPHYELTFSKRNQAIAQGAEEVSDVFLVELIQQNRMTGKWDEGKKASEDRGIKDVKRPASNGIGNGKVDKEEKKSPSVNGKRQFNDAEKRIIDDLDNMEKDMSTWESNFMETMCMLVEKKYRVSEKQLERLHKIGKDYGFE